MVVSCILAKNKGRFVVSQVALISQTFSTEDQSWAGHGMPGVAPNFRHSWGSAALHERKIASLSFFRTSKRKVGLCIVISQDP